MTTKNKPKVFYDYTKLRCLMVKKHCKQKDLAKVLDISQTRLSVILNDKLSFTPAQMEAIACFLEIPDEEFKSYFFAFFDAIPKREALYRYGSTT